MAILDAKLVLSDAQSLTAKSATASTNVVDLSGGLMVDAWGTADTPDIGEGGEIELNVIVNTAMVGASITMAVSLVTKAASATITTGGTTLASFTFPAASAAGTKWTVKVPGGAVQRYLGVVYDASGSGLTSSKFDAYLSLSHQTVL